MDLSDLVATMPFAVGMGVELTEASADMVVGTMSWRAELCTIGGVLHGGVLMGFADSVGAVCAVFNLPPGTRTSTLESKTNLIRGVKEGTLTATSTPLHAGRSSIVVQTHVRDEGGRLVSLTIQTQAVLT